MCCFVCAAVEAIVCSGLEPAGRWRVEAPGSTANGLELACVKARSPLPVTDLSAPSICGGGLGIVGFNAKSRAESPLPAIQSSNRSVVCRQKPQAVNTMKRWLSNHQAFKTRQTSNVCMPSLSLVLSSVHNVLVGTIEICSVLSGGRKNADMIAQ